MTPTDIFALGRAASPSTTTDNARSGRTGGAGESAMPGSDDFERALKNDGRSAKDESAGASGGEDKAFTTTDNARSGRTGGTAATRKAFAAQGAKAVSPGDGPDAPANTSEDAKHSQTSESETMPGSAIIDISEKNVGSVNEAAESAKTLTSGVAKSRTAATANRRDAFQSVVVDGSSADGKDGRQTDVRRDDTAGKPGSAAPGRLASGGAHQMVEAAGDAVEQAGGETREPHEQAQDQPALELQPDAGPQRIPIDVDASGEIPPETPAGLDHLASEAETVQSGLADLGAAQHGVAGAVGAGAESVRSRVAAPGSGVETRMGSVSYDAQVTVAGAARSAGALEQAAGVSDAMVDGEADAPLPTRSAQATVIPQAPQATIAAANPVVAAESAARLGGDGSPVDQVMTLESASGSSWRLDADTSATGSARAAEAQAGASGRPQTVAQQLTFAVSAAKDGPVEVRLDPQELGRVQIQMHTSEDGVRAVIIAERAETQDLLRRHAEMLTRELNEAGFGSVTLDFTSGGQADARQEDNVSAEGRLGSTDADPAISGQVTQAQPAQRPVGTGLANLDIRL